MWKWMYSTKFGMFILMTVISTIINFILVWLMFDFEQLDIFFIVTISSMVYYLILCALNKQTKYWFKI